MDLTFFDVATSLAAQADAAGRLPEEQEVSGWTITAGVLGLLGFLVSALTYFRQRPAIFLIGPAERFVLTEGQFEPLDFTFEIHNAGASGVTISAIDVVEKGRSATHHAPRGVENYFFGTQAPVRIEPYDTKVIVFEIGRAHV